MDAGQQVRFHDALADGTVVVDPSRVAAQIVAGVGFIGGGIIFVKRDSVRGVTTAAGIFLTAAIGACAGSGLILLVIVAPTGYFIAILLLPPVVRFAKRYVNVPMPLLRVRFLEGQGILPRVINTVTAAGFHVKDVRPCTWTPSALLAQSRTRIDDPLSKRASMWTAKEICAP